MQSKDLITRLNNSHLEPSFHPKIDELVLVINELKNSIGFNEDIKSKLYSPEIEDQIYYLTFVANNNVIGTSVLKFDEFDFLEFISYRGLVKENQPEKKLFNFMWDESNTKYVKLNESESKSLGLGAYFKPLKSIQNEESDEPENLTVKDVAQTVKNTKRNRSRIIPSKMNFEFASDNEGSSISDEIVGAKENTSTKKIDFLELYEKGAAELQQKKETIDFSYANKQSRKLDQIMLKDKSLDFEITDITVNVDKVKEVITKFITESELAFDTIKYFSSGYQSGVAKFFKSRNDNINSKRGPKNKLVGVLAFKSLDSNGLRIEQSYKGEYKDKVGVEQVILSSTYKNDVLVRFDQNDILFNGISPIENMSVEKPISIPITIRMLADNIPRMFPLHEIIYDYLNETSISKAVASTRERTLGFFGLKDYSFVNKQLQKINCLPFIFNTEIDHELIDNTIELLVQETGLEYDWIKYPLATSDEVVVSFQSSATSKNLQNGLLVIQKDQAGKLKIHYKGTHKKYFEKTKIFSIEENVNGEFNRIDFNDENFLLLEPINFSAEVLKLSKGLNSLSIYSNSRFVNIVSTINDHFAGLKPKVTRVTNDKYLESFGVKVFSKKEMKAKLNQDNSSTMISEDKSIVNHLHPKVSPITSNPSKKGAYHTNSFGGLEPRIIHANKIVSSIIVLSEFYDKSVNEMLGIYIDKGNNNRVLTYEFTENKYLKSLAYFDSERIYHIMNSQKGFRRLDNNQEAFLGIIPGNISLAETSRALGMLLNNMSLNGGRPLNLYKAYDRLIPSIKLHEIGNPEELLNCWNMFNFTVPDKILKKHGRYKING